MEVINRIDVKDVKRAFQGKEIVGVFFSGLVLILLLLLDWML
jgi:hypothetical protein